MDSGHVILSSLTPEALAARFEEQRDGLGQREREDEKHV
jgi:regulator of extracellular matrix RemA (YlzA/DUF370 family)